MGVTLTVLRKELKESLRDFHVLVYSIGFPLLFYPLLVWGIFQLSLLDEGKAEREPPRVVWQGPETDGILLLGEPVQVVEGNQDTLARGEIDLIATAETQGEALTVTLWHDSTRGRSRRALEVVTERLETLKETRMGAVAIRFAIDESLIQDQDVVKENLAPPARMRAWLIGQALPGMLLLIMLISALYPAVEVIVGERERGTLETTLSSSAPRHKILAGKVMCVVVLTLIAAVGNAAAMGLTLLHVMSLLAGQGDTDEDLTSLAVHWDQLLLTLPVILATAIFIAATMVVAVLPARSFKGGQNSGTVALSIGMGLAMVAFLPLTRLTPLTALLPLTGPALVIREAIGGHLTPLPYLLCLGCTSALAMGLLFIGAQITRGEAFLFGGVVPRWLAWLSWGEKPDDHR